MTNSEKILKFLTSRAPNSFSNSDISTKTGVRPHAQVFQITRNLMDSHQINGRLFGSEWVFWVDDAASAPLPQRKTETTIQPPREFEGVDSPAAKFERQARSKMSKFFNTVLREMGLDGVRKRFDFVSEDGEIVGDAKYYSMVKGERFPPAKISVITEHVWLLEKTNARQKFLVFGNDRRVPAAWLERFGELVDGVDFYFLSDDDELTKLN